MKQSTTENVRLCDLPLATDGLTSYRCKGRLGYIMIGATSDADALRQARRSWNGATADLLEVWDGEKYVPVKQAPHV